MYLGIIFFTWPRQTIFIESPPQILGKFLIQFLVLESNGEFDTPISNLINFKKLFYFVWLGHQDHVLIIEESIIADETPSAFIRKVSLKKSWWVLN